MAVNNGEAKNSECRDFQRGVCNRGNNCKFYHPPNTNPIKTENKLPICKDFQNKGCDRNKCKFLHVTQQEEEEYNATGILPAHGGKPEKVRALGITGGRGGGKAFPRPPLPADVCKDFLNGVCNRGKCKFRHISEEPGPMYGKRRRNDFGGAGDYMGNGLMEENEMLRRKITDLQRQVVDLRQMNDTLYEQNSRYRTQLRGGPGAAATPAAAAPASNAYNATTAYPALSSGSDQYQYSSYDGYSKF